MNSGSAKTWLIALTLAVILLAVLRSAGDYGYWHRYLAALVRGTTEPAAAQVQPRTVVKGGDGGAVPTVTPEGEGLYAQAVADALDAARKLGVSALVVHRHGHRVAAYFASGTNGSTLLTGGQLSPALLMLATGVLVDSRHVNIEPALAAVKAAAPAAGWRNPWSAAARSQFLMSTPPDFLMQDLEGSLANTLSLRVWQPLGAGDAFLWGADPHVRLDCCVAARLDDWMRVGDLLLRQGEYEGSRIVSVDWMRRVLPADANGTSHPIWIATPGSLTGDEPPAAHETFWFDLGPRVRLWLLPRRGLSILVWAAGAAAAHDPVIPNLLIRGLVEQSVAPGATSNISDIVPGH